MKHNIIITCMVRDFRIEHDKDNKITRVTINIKSLCTTFKQRGLILDV